MIQRHGRKAAGHGLQVTHGGRDQRCIDTHQAQHGFAVPEQQAAQAARQQGQPERLAYQWADAGVLAGAKAHCNLGCGGQQDAGHQQEQRYPQRVAKGYGSQVGGTDPAGHEGVDEAHGGMCQLGDDDGHGEAEQGAQLVADALGFALHGVHTTCR